MSKPTDITPYRDKPEFIRKTAEQIIKDFEVAGETITFSGNMEQPYQELYNQIVPLLEHLMRSSYERFLFLLYRIDISEHAIANAVNQATDVPLTQVLAHLVIERELKKVVLRHWFSQQNN